jgi:hypothetical protein
MYKHTALQVQHEFDFVITEVNPLADGKIYGTTKAKPSCKCGWVYDHEFYFMADIERAYLYHTGEPFTFQECIEKWGGFNVQDIDF